MITTHNGPQNEDREPATLSDEERKLVERINGGESRQAPQGERFVRRLLMMPLGFM